MRNRIIIMVSALVLLVAAYFILIKIEPSKKPEEQPKESISIFKTESDNIASITIKTPDYEYTFEKKEDSWYKTGNGDSSYLNQSEIVSLAGDFANLTAESLIANDGNLSDYGLDKPVGTPKIKLKDGTEKQFIVGSIAPTGSGYYFKDADSSTIYTIYTSTAEGFISKLDKYRNKTIATASPQDFTDFSLKRADAEIILRAKDKSEITETSLNAWIMLAPYSKECSNEVLSKEVFEKLQFEIKDFVEDSPKSYAAYGLDNPKYIISFKEKDKDPVTIYLGNEKDGAIYLKLKDKPYVYTMGLSSVPYKDISPLRLIDTLIYLKNIDLVNTVTLYANEEYTLKITRDGENATYFINGITADESKFKKAYQELIGLSLAGVVDKPVTGKQMCKIVYNFNDGSPDGIVEVYEYGDRYAAVKTDGNIKFYVMRDQVESMINNVKSFLDNPAK